MTTATVADTLRAWLAARFLPDADPATLRDDTPLITGGLLDADGLVELLRFVEAEFGATISLRDIADHGYDLTDVDTLAGLARAIEMNRTVPNPSLVPDRHPDPLPGQLSFLETDP